MNRAALLAAAVLLATSGAAGAQMYKWTDKDGRVQYTDRPPAGAKTESVQPRVGTVTGGAAAAAGAPAAGAPQAPMSYAEKDQAFRKRQMEQEEARTKQAKADEQKKQRAEHCAQAKSRLAGLEAGGRIVRFNEKGERVYLDDAQLESERGRARQDVNSICAS